MIHHIERKVSRVPTRHTVHGKRQKEKMVLSSLIKLCCKKEKMVY